MQDKDERGLPIGTVVVGVDGSAPSRTALRWSIDQAVAEKRPLTLACAEARGTGQGGYAILQHARTEVARRSPTTDVHALLVTADPSELLLQLSEQASVVVVGSRGRGPARSRLLGSVGVALTRHAACPVIVVRPGNPGLVRHGVLVGVDGSERSQGTLEFAFRHASLHRLPLTVMHTTAESLHGGTASVGRVPVMVDVRSDHLERERLLLAECVSGMQEQYPDVRLRTEVTSGPPAARLLQEAARMNLIVVGSHADGLTSELFPVAVAVVEHANCPVAVVPAVQTSRTTLAH